MMTSVTRVGFWAGLAAGLLVVIAMYFGWFMGHVPAVALALWERQMRLIPLALAAYGVLFAVVSTALIVMQSPRTATGTPASGGVTRREVLSRTVTILIASAAGISAAQWVLTAVHRATAAVQSAFVRVRGL